MMSVVKLMAVNRSIVWLIVSLIFSLSIITALQFLPLHFLLYLVYNVFASPNYDYLVN